MKTPQIALLPKIYGPQIIPERQAHSQLRALLGTTCLSPHAAASGVLATPFRLKRLLDRDPGRSLRVVSAPRASVLFCVCPAATLNGRE